MSRAAPGRPRDRQIDDAVLVATAEVLDTRGYRAVAMEDVARRAGVSKSAVYRRWPERARLVLAVLARRMTHPGPPRTGCTLCDLHEVLAVTTATYCTLGAGTVAQLLAETTHDPALRAELLAVVVDPVREVVRAGLAEALERGDLRSDTDLGLSADTVCFLVFHRLLVDQNPLTDREIETVVTGLLRGIAADPEALLRQYRARADAHHDHAPE